MLDGGGVVMDITLDRFRCATVQLQLTEGTVEMPNTVEGASKLIQLFESARRFSEADTITH